MDVWARKRIATPVTGGSILSGDAGVDQMGLISAAYPASKLVMIARIFHSLLSCALIACVPGSLFARAGGGGGGGGFSGGGGGGGGFSGGGFSGGGFSSGGGSSRPMTEAEFYIFLVFVVIIIVANLMKKAKDDGPRTRERSMSQRQNEDAIIKARKAIPGFKFMDMREKVRKAFTEIQDAWEAQDMAAVRRYVSDGIYQRFNTQFVMMRLLDQTNALSNLHIHNIWMARFERSGPYDVIDVGITATLTDQFVCAKNPKLDSGGTETFTEYWSFIRKQGAAERDIYHSTNCPECGSPLAANLGEVSRCQHCDALVNSGEFDWVLAEITQKDDYEFAPARHSPSLEQRLSAISERFPGFATQVIEDHASNAYFQILAARTTGRPEKARRFTTDAFYRRVTDEIAKAREATKGIEAYNRLYLRQARLSKVWESNGKTYIAVMVKPSFQKALVSGRRAKLLHEMMITHLDIVVMSRSNASAGQGSSVFAMECPSCGGKIADTTEVKCRYCGSLHNSGEHDWVVEDIQSASTFRESAFMLPSETPSREEKRDDVESLADPEYLMVNNILAVAMADRKFKTVERRFAERVGHSLHIPRSDLDRLIRLAEGNRVSVRLPDDRSKRDEMIKLMVQTSELDGYVAQEEKDMIASLARR